MDKLNRSDRRGLGDHDAAEQGVLVGRQHVADLEGQVHIAVGQPRDQDVAGRLEGLGHPPGVVKAPEEAVALARQTDRRHRFADVLGKIDVRVEKAHDLAGSPEGGESQAVAGRRGGNEKGHSHPLGRLTRTTGFNCRGL